MHESAQGLAVLMLVAVGVKETPQFHDDTAADVRGLLQLAQLILGALCNAVDRTTRNAV